MYTSQIRGEELVPVGGVTRKANGTVRAYRLYLSVEVESAGPDGGAGEGWAGVRWASVAAQKVGESGLQMTLPVGKPISWILGFLRAGSGDLERATPGYPRSQTYQ